MTRSRLTKKARRLLRMNYRQALWMTHHRYHNTHIRTTKIRNQRASIPPTLEKSIQYQVWR